MEYKTSSQEKINQQSGSNQSIFNKKGATFQFWIEIIIFMGIFLFVVSVIGLDMNSRYDKDHDLTLGLNISPSISSLENYRTDIVNSTADGQTSVTDYGILKLTTVPSILMSVTRILWSFVSGSFIFALIMKMGLGEYGIYIARMFQMLYVVAITFLLIKLVLRSPV